MERKTTIPKTASGFYFVIVSSIRILILCLITYILAGCRNFLEVDDPIDTIDTKLIFKDEKSAKAAVNGIYSVMMEIQGQVCNSAMSLHPGLSADELYYYSPNGLEGFTNNNIGIQQQTDIQTRFWSPAYKYIYTANNVLDGLSASSLPEELKNELSGEAKFIRAFCYFQLVNLFGKVPLLTSSDYKANAVIGRSEINEVYGLIIDDLKAAITQLKDEPVNAERTLPGKFAAKSLLSRVYLYNRQWEEAEHLAAEVINSGLYSLSAAEQTFLSSSKETIWQLKPTNLLRNTFEAREIVPASAGASPTYLMTEVLFNSFNDEDKRKQNWIATRTFAGQTVHYPYKYKVRGGSGIPQTEYCIVFRLAELYLIHAEALAQQGKTAQAIADLKAIRSRAGVWTEGQIANNIGREMLLTEIAVERRKELFTEWGHRWFDLKRTGLAEAVLKPLKPQWKEGAELWPVPDDELNKNPNLLPQNKGY